MWYWLLRFRQSLSFRCLSVGAGRCKLLFSLLPDRYLRVLTEFSVAVVVVVLHSVPMMVPAATAAISSCALVRASMVLHALKVREAIAVCALLILIIFMLTSCMCCCVCALCDGQLMPALWVRLM